MNSPGCASDSFVRWQPGVRERADWTAIGKHRTRKRGAMRLRGARSCRGVDVLSFDDFGRLGLVGVGAVGAGNRKKELMKFTVCWVSYISLLPCSFYPYLNIYYCPDDPTSAFRISLLSYLPSLLSILVPFLGCLSVYKLLDEFPGRLYLNNFLSHGCHYSSQFFSPRGSTWLPRVGATSSVRERQGIAARPLPRSSPANKMIIANQDRMQEITVSCALTG